MNKKIALLVYPNFSLQEIGSISGLFRWAYDSETVVFSSSLEAVRSEEGLLIKPEKVFEDFSSSKYDALILSGCSDFRSALRDEKLQEFLRSLKGEKDLVIGAICAGPIFLSRAGVLEGRKFTNSLFVEINQAFDFIDEENLVYRPLVEDGNIITAVGSAFNEFAVAVARKLGYEAPDEIYTGVPKDWKPEDYKQYMGEENFREFKEEFKDLL